MERKVRISRRAALSLENLLAFLEEKWSWKVKNEFVNKLDKSIKNITRFPDSYPESQKIKGLKKCIITRQTSIFYKYSDETVDIVALMDNRQNPDTVIKELRD